MMVLIVFVIVIRYDESYIFFYFVDLSCHTHTHKSRAQSEKHCRRRGASSGQKTRGCIEGEKNGRRRYKEVLIALSPG